MGPISENGSESVRQREMEVKKQRGVELGLASLEDQDAAPVSKAIWTEMRRIWVGK